jgi:hypothetical protein
MPHLRRMYENGVGVPTIAIVGVHQRDRRERAERLQDDPRPLEPVDLPVPRQDPETPGLQRASERGHELALGHNLPRPGGL